MHTEALYAYYRLGGEPPELGFLRPLLHNAKRLRFDGRIPDTWYEIYGASLGADLELPPPEEPALIEDDTSCVLLWNGQKQHQRGIGGPIGYLQAQRVNLAGVVFISLGDPQETAALERTIDNLNNGLKIDYGMLLETRHDPARGFLGYEGMVCPIGSYLVDADTGVPRSTERNTKLINEMLSRQLGHVPYPTDRKGKFDEEYVTGVQANVVEAVHQYALLTRNV